LVPEPTFQSRSAVLNFASPVFGVGANVFDDYYDLNVITLTVTTVSGHVLSVSENSTRTGNAGFLGAISPEGIVRAEFSIDGNASNLEIDHLRVAARFPGPPGGQVTDPSADNGTSVNFVNASFEEPAMSPPWALTNSMPGWDGPVDLHHVTDLPAADGSQVVDLNRDDSRYTRQAVTTVPGQSCIGGQLPLQHPRLEGSEGRCRVRDLPIEDDRPNDSLRERPSQAGGP
jgi:hypothetical protein